MKNDHFFLMSYDFDHLNDSEFDAFVVPFDNYLDIKSSIISINEFEIPEILYFLANFKIISHIDYPINDLGWPIISNKILSYFWPNTFK